MNFLVAVKGMELEVNVYEYVHIHGSKSLKNLLCKCKEYML